MITNNKTNPFPFLQILTLILVVAKIAGLVQFSWWIVLSPMMFLVAIIMLLQWLIKKGL